MFSTAYQKCLQDLGESELHEILALGNRVFITEQKSPFHVVGEKRQATLHVTIYNDDPVAQDVGIISYGWFSSRETEPSLRMGKILKNVDCIGGGDVRDVMSHVLKYIHQSFSRNFQIQVQAQESQREFYRGLGFRVSSYPYWDGGVIYMDMVMDKTALAAYIQKKI